jgi:hypothetical protein
MSSLARIRSIFATSSVGSPFRSAFAYNLDSRAFLKLRINISSPWFACLVFYSDNCHLSILSPTVSPWHIMRWRRSATWSQVCVNRVLRAAEEGLPTALERGWVLSLTPSG